MKKFLSTLLAVVMATGMAMPAFAADTAIDTPDRAVVASAAQSPFKDVDVTTPQGQAILKMYQNGCLAGYEDGTFRPDGNVTRAELVRIINQVFGFKVDEKYTITDFSDNSNKDAWFYSDVRCAQQMGYINGFGDNSFRPQDNFTRQQACVVLSLLTNAKEGEQAPEISDAVSPWAVKYVNASINSGLFTLEDGNTFRATQNITRGELCAALAGFITEKTTEVTTEATTKALTEGTTKKADKETTESTTKKPTISGGGGGGNNNNSKTTTTTTTTEATTETTTTAANSKPNNKTTTTTTTTTTETTTELTTAEIEVDASLLNSVKRTKRNIDRYVIPKASGNVASIAQQISDAMGNFMNDHSYDVQSAANSAMDDYHALSESEKSEFKQLVLGYCAMSDLVELRDKFFPGLTV